MAAADYLKIRDAILQKLQIIATYHGLHREFCPYVIGTKHGKQHVLGYQFAGQSSKGLPSNGEWRCFDIAQFFTLSTRTGRWYTGNVHTQPQRCVNQIDAEVNF